MTNILDEIVSHKLNEIEFVKSKTSLESLSEMINEQNIPLNLVGSLMATSISL